MKKTLIIILLACSSCGVTVKVQGVPVHSPQQTVSWKDIRNAVMIGVVGYGLTEHLVNDRDQQKVGNKIKKILK